jgi:hypothetical protein
MRKYTISEQFVQDASLEEFKAITDPKLRAAAAAKCFPDGYTINVKHPDTGVDTIYVQSKKPENVNNKHVFFKPDGTLDYRTTSDNTGKLVRTANWTCYALLERTNPETSGVQQEFLSALQSTLGWLPYASVKGNDILKYDLTNVAVDSDLKPNGLYWNVVSGLKPYLDDLAAQGRPFYMWRPKKASAPIKKMEEEQARILAQFPGYKICSPSEGEKSDFIVIDIHQYYPDFFTKGTKLCTPAAALSPKQKDDALMKLVDKIKTKASRGSCKNLISLYYDAIKKNTPISQNKINQIKPWVSQCSTEFNFPGLKSEINYMQRIKVRGQGGQILDFSLLESKNDNLSMIVSESLLKLKEQKNKKIISERNEVKKRLGIIFESFEIKNKRDLELFSDYLLGEMVRLRKDGYSEEIISEQLDIFSAFSNLFSGGKGGDFLSSLKGAAGGGIMSVVVETIAGGLLKSMGIDPNGTLGTLIKKTLTNLTPADLPKLSDCRFVSGLLTKSILETIAAEATKSIGGKSMLGSFIENTLFELGEQSEIFQSIKNFVGDKIVCPYLEGKGGNILSGLFGK